MSLSPVSFIKPRSLLAALTLTVTCTLATPSRAQQLRFTTTAPGGIASAGNTLGLSKAWASNGPGVEDSIGTFTSLSNASYDDLPTNITNPWPSNTTWDWTQNGSEALLALPPAVQVLYAELVWGGSYAYQENVSAYLDDPVTLGVGTASMSVTPDPSTAQTIAETSYQNFAANYYIRSADVTAFVQQQGAGSYRVEGVPATQGENINSLNAAGWSLVVVYLGEDQPVRNLSVFVGGSFVDEDSQQDYTVSGFCAPPFGNVEGNIVVSALEGDADLTGDELLIAPTVAGPFATLSGPNNPASNFFCSQLNDANGLLDTNGTFGNANHDPFNGINIAGGRQGWDLTTVAVSSASGQLDNDQTSAVVRTNTTGDSFVPTMVALEIDVKSPDLTDGSSTLADKTVALVGDTIDVTATVHNSGEALADNLLLVMNVDPGLDLASYSTDGQPGDINGGSVTEADVVAGVDAGQLPVNGTRVVVMRFDVVGAPENGASFVFTPNWEHSFEMCAGGQPIQNSYGPPAAVVAYDGGASTGVGAGGADSTGSGSGSAQGGSTGAGNLGGDGDDVEQTSGCGCQLPGDAPDSRAALLVALAGILLASRRRRRHL